jgi:DNA-binding transcriptional ArsR family regulator
MIADKGIGAYNTLVKMNISNSIIDLSEILTCMAQPARIQILMGLDTQEACVCHLETILGMSQASISQHLMILRKSGLVVTRRDGRHIYYSLSNPSLLDIFRKAAVINRIEIQFPEYAALAPIPGCPCPVCNPGIDPKLACKKVRKKKNKTGE